MLELLDRTSLLSKVAYWEKVAPFEACDWSGLLGRLLLEVNRGNSPIPPFNVYADGALRPWLREKIRSPELARYSDVQDFMKAWLGEKGYFLIISLATSWSTDLHELIYESLTRELVAGTGGLRGGIDVYAVLGDCGFTPFSVHCDDEPIFLIHAGPNDKEIWVSDAAPRAGPGETTLGDHSVPAADAWMKGAQRFVMRPGDMIFIPAGTYHLLRSHGFAASIGVDIFQADSRSLLLKAMKGVALNLPGEEDCFFWPNDTEPGESFATRIRCALSPSDQLFEALAAQVADRDALLRSNGYVLEPPAIGCADGAAADWFRPVAGSSLIARTGESGSVILYMRGRAVEVGEAQLQTGVLAVLQDGRAFDRQALYEASDGRRADAELVLQLALRMGCVCPVTEEEGVCSA